MSTKMRYLGASLALVALLTACTVGPAGTQPRPTVAVPTTASAEIEAAATQIATATAAATEAATASISPTAADAGEASPAAREDTPTVAAETAATAAPPPIACTPGELTPSQMEGPYYKANPPQAASLVEPGMAGTRITVTGYVLDAQCQPVPGARVDFWQADSEGQYDNQGYTLRGYQLTDAQGRYTLETVVPGRYPGRPPHIHVKVTAPDGPTLTSQLYFPGEGDNASDRIFDPALLVTVDETAAGTTGTFNFVIQSR